jgi:hypothetical protein
VLRPQAPRTVSRSAPGDPHCRAPPESPSHRAAFERWRALRGMPREGTPHLALDPARKGPDSSVLALRYGDVVEELVVWQKLRTTDSARRAVAEMERLGVPLSRGITVDEPGLGGGVIDALEDLGVHVRPFNGGQTPTRRGQEAFRKPSR